MLYIMNNNHINWFRERSSGGGVSYFSISALCISGRSAHRNFSSPADLVEIVKTAAFFHHASTSLISHSKMAEDQNPAATSSQDAKRQVRVQLTSKQEDIALPENTGPILVPTG